MLFWHSILSSKYTFCPGGNSPLNRFVQSIICTGDVVSFYEVLFFVEEHARNAVFDRGVHICCIYKTESIQCSEFRQLLHLVFLKLFSRYSNKFIGNKVCSLSLYKCAARKIKVNTKKRYFLRWDYVSVKHFHSTMEWYFFLGKMCLYFNSKWLPKKIIINSLTGQNCTGWEFYEKH